MEKIDLRIIRPEGIANAVAVEMRAFLYGERKDGLTITYPSDWKESFKERWLPQWMLEKWPVRYTSKTVKFQVLYPDFKPPKGNMTSIVKTIVETDEDQDDVSRW